AAAEGLFCRTWRLVADSAYARDRGLPSSPPQAPRLAQGQLPDGGELVLLLVLRQPRPPLLLGQQAGEARKAGDLGPHQGLPLDEGLGDGAQALLVVRQDAP